MMDAGANVNFLMFSGGTNFGFTAGANNGKPLLYSLFDRTIDYSSNFDCFYQVVPENMSRI